VRSWEALKGAIAAANVIVLSSGPSSVYLLDFFEKRGVLASLHPKIKQLPPGHSVGEALARGEKDIGFTFRLRFELPGAEVGFANPGVHLSSVELEPAAAGADVCPRRENAVTLTSVP
jgi:hypothetical protein